MRAINKSVLLMLITFLASASTPVEKLVPVKNVFSPEGFDSNDNVEIIIEGQLPNLCHKSPKKTVTVKGTKIDIKITALHYHKSNPYCPKMVVPFLEKVDVGVLEKGSYEITVNGQSVYKKEGSIKVAESTSDAIDESVYARVEYIEKIQDSRTVKLRGYNPSDCFVFDKVEIVDNKKDVYSILPKMKQVSNVCPMEMMPFEYEVEVPNKLKKERVLLHVRSMDGKSINSIFKNK